MLRSTASSLLASLVVLAAITGCVASNTDAASEEVTDSVTAAGAAMASPSPGHEVHRMFQAEKSNASFSELPAQF